MAKVSDHGQVCTPGHKAVWLWVGLCGPGREQGVGRGNAMPTAEQPARLSFVQWEPSRAGPPRILLGVPLFIPQLSQVPGEFPQPGPPGAEAPKHCRLHPPRRKVPHPARGHEEGQQ